AHQSRVIPGNFCDRLGKLLQPSVVRVLSIANRRVGAEYDLKRARIARGLRLLREIGAHANGNRSECRAGDEAAMERSLPKRFKGLVLLRALALPVGPHKLVKDKAFEALWETSLHS